ncbi:MAG: ComEA family DNA-binding protein [Phycisphaerales bacterium]
MTYHPTTHGARWGAALLVSGVGLAGLGYSLATRPTPAPNPVVFLPEPAEPRTGPIDSGSQRTSASTKPRLPAADEDAEPSTADVPTSSGLLIDLNAAPATQLELLPGIGPARAAAIVANRQALGPFQTIDDLERIRGIGPATVEGLRPFVTLGLAGEGG